MDILFLALPLPTGYVSALWQVNCRYLVPYLRSRQISCGLFYGTSSSAPSLAVYLAQCLAMIEKEKPRILALEMTENNSQEALKLFGKIKKKQPQLHLTFFGPLAFIDHRKILRSRQADSVIYGDEELVLSQMIERIKAQASCGRIKGLVLPANGRPKINPPQEPIQDLDTLPLQELSGLKKLIGDARTGYLAASRGCYGNCSFCIVPPYYGYSGRARWRGKSPQRVVKEIRQLQKALRVDRIVFVDNCFWGPGKSGQIRAREIASEISRQRIKIHFSVAGRSNDLDLETLKILKKAGLTDLCFALESASDRALRLFRKGTTTRINRQAVRIVKKLGLPAETNLIFFDPYMNETELRANLGLLDKISALDNFRYSDAFPYNELVLVPSSPLIKRLKNDGLLDRGLRYKYQDPKIGLIASLVLKLKYHPALTFKKRFIFAGIDPGLLNDPQAAELDRPSTIFKDWLIFQKIPALIRGALKFLRHRSLNETTKRRLEDKFRRAERQIAAFCDKLGF